MPESWGRTYVPVSYKYVVFIISANTDVSVCDQKFIFCRFCTDLYVFVFHRQIVLILGKNCWTLKLYPFTNSSTHSSIPSQTIWCCVAVATRRLEPPRCPFPQQHHSAPPRRSQILPSHLEHVVPPARPRCPPNCWPQCWAQRKTALHLCQVSCSAVAHHHGSPHHHIH